MEDLVYRYSAMQGSTSRCIDIAQASSDPESPVVAIAIGGRSVILDQQTAKELARRVTLLATPAEPNQY
jgi:hypothetical protein